MVLVFDTDKNDTAILLRNIQFLQKHSAVKEVLCIPQVKNMEDELVYSCNLKSVKELTGSKSLKDFKRDLLKCSNIASRLKNCGFSIVKFWSRMPQNKFSGIPNDAEKIKIYSGMS